MQMVRSWVFFEDISEALKPRVVGAKIQIQNKSSRRNVLIRDVL